MERNKTEIFRDIYLAELRNCNSKLAPLSISTEIINSVQTEAIVAYPLDEEDKKTEMYDEESEEDDDPFEEEKDETVMEGFTNQFVTTAPRQSQKPKKNHKLSE